MRHCKTYLATIVAAVLFAALLTAPAAAQITADTKPRRDKLLNGLKVLVLRDPSAKDVTVKIRVHGGSAFDLQEREGTMRLLAESIFPTELQRSFFTEDLGGTFELISNYDFIQVNVSSRPDNFLTILESVATAVAQPTIDKETVAKLKAELLETITELEKDPKYIGDHAAAKHLFGTFPYGRPAAGTRESLANVDFADLIFAKDRIFTADNATVVISGNVDAGLALRAGKRYFGAWLKADEKTPSTFARPDAPTAELKIIESPVDHVSELRFITRGVAAKDADRHATKILTNILDARMKQVHSDKAFVKSMEHVLPGSIVFGVSEWYLGEIKKAGDTMAIPDSSGYHTELFSNAVTDAEFDAAKAKYLSTVLASDISDRWLDVDTFGTKEPRAELDAIRNVKLADVQERLKELQAQPFGYVLVFADKAAEQPAKAEIIDTGTSDNDR